MTEPGSSNIPGSGPEQTQGPPTEGDGQSLNTPEPPAASPETQASTSEQPAPNEQAPQQKTPKTPISPPEPPQNQSPTETPPANTQRSVPETASKEGPREVFVSHVRQHPSQTGADAHGTQSARNKLTSPK